MLNDEGGKEKDSGDLNTLTRSDKEASVKSFDGVRSQAKRD